MATAGTRSSGIPPWSACSGSWPDGQPDDATPIWAAPGLGDDSRSLHSAGHEPRDPPPAAAAGGAHPGQSLPPLGLHPGPGAPAVAPRERGGHDHGLESAPSMKLNSPSTRFSDSDVSAAFGGLQSDPTGHPAQPTGGHGKRAMGLGDQGRCCPVSTT
jgi:hypothetical protein